MAIINEKTGSVKLVNGKATIRYKLTDPLPVVDNMVKCTVNAPIGATKTLRVPKIVIPEVFVLSLKKISDSVVITITSTIPDSTTSVSINIDESRDGSPNRIPIGNVTHPVTLVNGVGTHTYAIRQPKPATAGRVAVKIINTNPLVTQSVNVAAYVPPPPPPDYIRGTVTVIPDYPVTDNMPLSGTITGTVTWSGWGGLYITSGRYNIYAGVMVSSNSQGQQTTPLNSASGSFRFSIPYALTSSTQTNRQILVTATGPSTAQHIKEGTIMPHPG